jgi:tetratricopeptide (TPR) repeat protein
MKKLQLFFCALLIISLWACNTEKKKLKQKIVAAEAKANIQDAEMAVARALLYEEYANKFKDDTLSPSYLYNAAELYQYASNHVRSLELLDTLLKRYPNSNQAPEALFFKGYIYEVQLLDLPKAKDAYEELINRFPNHPRTELAKINLPIIGDLPPWAKELDAGFGDVPEDFDDTATMK